MTTHENPPPRLKPVTRLPRIEAAAAALPAHRLRRTDVDPAARRAERQVSRCSWIRPMTVLFVVAFVAIPADETVCTFSFWHGQRQQHRAGVTFGLAILLIGTGAIHWSKKLDEREGGDPAAPPAGLQ